MVKNLSCSFVNCRHSCADRNPRGFTFFNGDFKLLKPTGHVMHQQFNIQQLYVLPTLYLCVLLFIWEQTATCATYSINWLVFITEMKFYCAVRTGSLNKAVCASSLKGATCATYSINWLVFITEMKSAYWAVRSGPLNKVACASSLTF